IGSDFAIFNVEAIRGHLTIHPSKIADVGTPDGQWPEAWVDPLEVFRELTREHDLKLFVAMRMIGRAYPMSMAPISRASFFWEHQEWVKRDREGLPTPTLSTAFPEVRAYWLSLLREALENY